MFGFTFVALPVARTEDSMTIAEIPAWDAAKGVVARGVKPNMMYYSAAIAKSGFNPSPS